MANGDLGFCGNPFNHPAHDIEGTDDYCAGVGRQEVTETIVEKYTPEVKEDGTEYSKVTILIEDSKGVTILHAAKASFPFASAKTEEHIPLDRESKMFLPEIKKVTFEFLPHVTDEAPALTIERKLNDG